MKSRLKMNTKHLLNCRFHSAFVNKANLLLLKIGAAVKNIVDTAIF